MIYWASGSSFAVLVLKANGIKDSHRVSCSLKNHLAEPCAWKIHEVLFRWSLLDSSSPVSACRAVAERLFWSATANGGQMALRCFTALATVSWHWAHSCQFVVGSVYPVQTHSTLSLSLSLSLTAKGQGHDRLIALRPLRKASMKVWLIICQRVPHLNICSCLIKTFVEFWTETIMQSVGMNMSLTLFMLLSQLLRWQLIVKHVFMESNLKT